MAIRLYPLKIENGLIWQSKEHMNIYDKVKGQYTTSL